MSIQPEALTLDGVPALRWGGPGGRAVIGVHGQLGDKRDPVLARCAEVIASHGDHLLTFDLPAHGERRDGTAFTAKAASGEVRDFVQLAREEANKISLLAISVGAYAALCDTPSGTFERAWLVSPLLDLERYVRDVMSTYSVTDERLEAKTVINTPRASLSWPDLCFLTEHPVRLDMPSWTIRGSRDDVVPMEALSRFLSAPGAELVEIAGGPHFLGEPPYLDTVASWFEQRYPAGR